MGNPARIFDHLDPAAQIIDATARATAARDAHATLAHIDAAQHLMTAAKELFGAAEDIAAGKPVEGHRAALGPDASPLALSLRIAEVKIAEALRLLDGAGVAVTSS